MADDNKNGCTRETGATPDPQGLKNFYEQEYERAIGIAPIPAPDDFCYSQVLQQLQPYLQPGSRVLDLGCNNGNLSMYMARGGCEVTGIDLAQNAVDAARRSATHHGLANVRFLCQDFLSEWTEPAYFDFIYCISVVEHIPDDRAFVRKIAWTLKPGGRLVLAAPTPHPLHYRLSMRLRGRYEFDEKVGHLRRYPAEGLAELCRQAGLGVTRFARLDGLLRDWVFLSPSLMFTHRFLDRPYVRSGFNTVDSWLARLLPGMVFVHARKDEGAEAAERAGA